LHFFRIFSEEDGFPHKKVFSQGKKKSQQKKLKQLRTNANLCSYTHRQKHCPRGRAK
jgi:hypothetical protein